MLTRIEIDGFKTFSNFKLRLAPFQVIIGANGVGKSNLFDALRLLSHLADRDLRTAFLNARGEAGELFTILPDGSRVPEMRFAVELFVDRRVRDDWGDEADLKYTRMRYELHIKRRSDPVIPELDRLYVTHESLTAVHRKDDTWLESFLGEDRESWLPRLGRGRNRPFISTEEEEGVSTLYLHQDGRSGRKAMVAERAQRTVLSGILNTEFPHAFAAREEIRSWKLLQLNPEALREPSPMIAPQHLATDGQFLASTLARMQAEDPDVLKAISLDLVNLVPGITGIEVVPDLERERYLIQATTQDSRPFSSAVLSDGTLRLLALLTLKHDPEHKGLLCFEEPENGVHPFRLGRMVEDVLRDLATDFRDASQADFPLQQLLVNTHSPVLAKSLDVRKELLFATMASHLTGSGPMQVTRIFPVVPSPQLQLDLDLNEQIVSYTLGQVISYLETVQPSREIATLREVAP